jgi:Predicted ATPase or kinase
LSPLPEGTVALIEWPERAAGALPQDRIDIALSHRPALGSTARAAEITGYGKAAALVARLKALRDFLDGAAISRPNGCACRETRRSVPMRGSSATMGWSS